MNTRTPQESTMTCFAMEYNPRERKCLGCAEKTRCYEAMDCRVPLTALTFKLAPEKVAMDTATGNVNQDMANDTYRHAFYSVFHAWPMADLGKDWNSAIINAKAANIDLKTFIITVMAAYKITHPKAPFYVNNITSATSIDKVESFKKLCLKNSAVFDSTTLGLVLGEDFEDCSIESKLLNSESVVGSYIAGFKMRFGGSALKDLYADKEFSLDPYWLAIEPSYTRLVLAPYCEDRKNNVDVNVSLDTQRHRHNVLQTRQMLMQKPRLATSVFAARERVMVRAVESVLKKHGLRGTDMYHKDEPVTDALQFWSAIGYVLQQLECNKVLQGKPHRLWNS